MRKSIRSESINRLNNTNDKSIYSHASQEKFKIFEEFSVAFMLLLCFGTIVNLYMKIMVSKFAPSWAPILYLIPLLYAVYSIVRKPINFSGLLLACIPLSFFCIWIVMSFLWSNQPSLSLKQGILFFITYIIAISICINFSLERLSKIFIIVFSFQAILSLFFAIFIPSLGVMTEIYPGAWCGIWDFKQSLGINMSFGIAFTIGYMLGFKNKNPIYFILVAIMFLNIVKSEATTSVIISILIIGLAIALLISRVHSSLALLSIWGIISFIVVAILSLTVFKDIVFSSIGKNPNLTGRTEIWASLQKYIDQKPILGWGFQAFWTDDTSFSPVYTIEAEMNGFKPPDAHSTPKDVMLQLGLIGFIVWAVMIFQTWFLSIYSFIKNNQIFVFICFLLAWTATCFTEALSLYPMEFMTLTLMIVIVKTFDISVENLNN